MGENNKLRSRKSFFGNENTLVSFKSNEFLKDQSSNIKEYCLDDTSFMKSDKENSDASSPMFSPTQEESEKFIFPNEKMPILACIKKTDDLIKQNSKFKNDGNEYNFEESNRKNNGYLYKVDKKYNYNLSIQSSLEAFADETTQESPIKRDSIVEENSCCSSDEENDYIGTLMDNIKIRTEESVIYDASNVIFK